MWKHIVVISLPFMSIAMRKNPVPIKLGEIYHKQWAEFILKHAVRSFLKGHAEAQRHWPLFELVVWVFFIECVWQKDNTLSQSAIHLRFQVAPGEFNLESVGLDTLVINQLMLMCVWVYLCVDLCVSLSVCDKSLSNPVQHTQCLSTLQPTEDKFIYKRCADKSWTRKLFYLTYSAAA